MRPANERRCYKVTPSLIGWAQTWNQLCNILDCGWGCARRLWNSLMLTHTSNMIPHFLPFYRGHQAWGLWFHGSRLQSCLILSQANWAAGVPPQTLLGTVAQTGYQLKIETFWKKKKMPKIFFPVIKSVHYLYEPWQLTWLKKNEIWIMSS